MYNSTYLPATATLTTTLLAASATYTGAAMDTNINGESEVDVSALSSIGGSTTNGFYIQSSNDSTNWITIATQTVTANVVGVITISVYQRYWRVIYTNSTTAQTGTFSIIAQTDVGIIPLIRPNTVHTGVSVPVYNVAGTNAIGTVGVTSLPALIAGSASIGNIGSIVSALPAGTNLIGKFTPSTDATNTTAYSAAATTVIKASAGRLVSLLVTGTVGTANVSIFDNASAASGTIIGLVPSGTAIGTVLVFASPAALGITVGGVAGNAAFTVMWN